MHVQYKEAGGSSASATVSFDTSPTPGNLLVIVSSFKDTPVSLSATDLHERIRHTNMGTTWSIYTKIADGTETSWTWTYEDGLVHNWAVQAFEFADFSEEVTSRDDYNSGSLLIFSQTLSYAGLDGNELLFAAGALDGESIDLNWNLNKAGSTGLSTLGGSGGASTKMQLSSAYVELSDNVGQQAILSGTNSRRCRSGILAFRRKTAKRWLPSRFSGLQAWWRPATAGVADGTPIPRLPDSSAPLSGKTKLTSWTLQQATTTKQPVYKSNAVNGKPVIRFDGIDDALEGAGALTQPVTYIIVSQARSSSVSYYWFDWTGYRHYFYKDLNWTDFQAGTNGGSVKFRGIANSTDAAPWATYEICYNDAASEVYKNSGVATQGNLGNIVTSGTFRLGSRQNGGECFPGDIAELIIVDHTLSTNERALLATYLQDQYGITQAGYNGASISLTDIKNISIWSNPDLAATTIDLKAPPQTQPGDLLLAQICFRASGIDQTITSPVGWNAIPETIFSGSTGSVMVGAYYRIAQAGDESATWTWISSAGTSRAGGIARITGADATSPIEAASGSFSGGAVTTHVAPTVTALGTNRLLLELHSVGFSTALTTDARTITQWNWPASRGNSIALSSQVVPPGATGIRAGTTTTTATSYSSLVLIKPQNFATSPTIMRVNALGNPLPVKKYIKTASGIIEGTVHRN
jgi:hypothetical protein